MVMAALFRLCENERGSESRAGSGWALSTESDEGSWGVRFSCNRGISYLRIEGTWGVSFLKIEGLGWVSSQNRKLGLVSFS
ncbi:hypothetical protein KFK09_010551 [Dendrobium nobile]|uniref:Uncharacterized protein n=1 Tax=Dendrobium nobile TaxID=94219 RepID=A0A8T3BCZ4_DENNO|nr:hypothetical protein KFK09_010551 [Dendrobium nobile]